jgi:hypothetical protein
MRARKLLPAAILILSGCESAAPPLADVEPPLTVRIPAPDFIRDQPGGTFVQEPVGGLPFAARPGRLALLAEGEPGILARARYDGAEIIVAVAPDAPAETEFAARLALARASEQGRGSAAVAIRAVDLERARQFVHVTPEGRHEWQRRTASLAGLAVVTLDDLGAVRMAGPAAPR